jgi:hypothetical protein
MIFVVKSSGPVEAGSFWPAPAHLQRQTRERTGQDPVDVTVGEVFKGRRAPDLDMIASYVPLLRGAVPNVRLKGTQLTIMELAGLRSPARPHGPL